MTPVNQQGSSVSGQSQQGYDQGAGLGPAFDGSTSVGPQGDPWAAPPLAGQEQLYTVDNAAQPRYHSDHKPLILPTPDKDKPKRKRSRVAKSQFLSLMSGTLTVLTLLGIVAFVMVTELYRVYTAKGPLAEVKAVVIPKGAGTLDISDLLAKNGVISNGPFLFWTQFQAGKMFFAGSSQMKAGEWEFKPGMSMADVIDLMDKGKPVQHKITFPEGWSSEQIVARINADPILEGKVTATPEEGTIMPNTYTFERGYTRDKLIADMRKAQERELKAIWDKKQEGLPLATMRDLVILASIVEKETSKADERGRVAGVFVNRLRKNMRLETDPTIIYGLYKGQSWTESRTLTKAELAAPNPYNTYKINGLPPGPIANPGRAALEAVANPQATGDLFFVADGNGGHVFAATLPEHNKNVANLRAIEAQRNAAAQPPPAPAEAPAIVNVPAPPKPQTPPKPVKPPAAVQNPPQAQGQAAPAQPPKPPKPVLQPPAPVPAPAPAQ